MLEHTLGLAGLSHLITPAANHVEAMRHVTVTASSVVSQLQHMFEQYVQKTRQGAAEDAGGVVEALDRVAAVLREEREEREEQRRQEERRRQEAEEERCKHLDKMLHKLEALHTSGQQVGTGRSTRASAKNSQSCRVATVVALPQGAHTASWQPLLLLPLIQRPFPVFPHRAADDSQRYLLSAAPAARQHGTHRSAPGATPTATATATGQRQGSQAAADSSPGGSGNCSSAACSSSAGAGSR